MEQQSALSTILCIIILIPTWGIAAVEIPVGCKKVGILNPGTSTQKPGALRVSQDPKSLNVTAGETVTLSCTFQNRGRSTAKALWLRGSREDVVVDSNHPFYRGRLNVSSLDEIRQGKATLIMSEVEERDSGLYQCCIEIQNKEMEKGEGTQLRVMRRIQSATGNRKELRLESHTELTIYRAMIALMVVGIILLAGALVLHRRKALMPPFSSSNNNLCLLLPSSEAATQTQLQQPAKRDRRSASKPSEGLHYAEINVKAPARTKYACSQIQRI